MFLLRAIFTSMKADVVTPTALVFDIKRYAVHDGPGIRTAVFFKGCPMRCRWCHNPEGADKQPELLLRPNMCSHCYCCLDVCPKGALKKDLEGSVTVDRDLCDCCAECVEVCVYDALQIAGQEMTVEILIREIEKDRIFFDQSGGGATLTGGEPLHQHEFVSVFLDELRSRSIHSAVDTAGYAPAHVFRRIACKADLLLFDLKLMDKERHCEHTGVSNSVVLENLRWATGEGLTVHIRLPLIPGVNDDENEVLQKADFLASLEAIRSVSILPYHKGGVEKAKRIGKAPEFPEFSVPSKEKTAKIVDIFQNRGFEVRIGG